MASSIAVSRYVAADVSLGSSLAADTGIGYYEQQYNRITGHNSSDVSHSTQPHSTNKIEEDVGDDGLNIIPPSCNEDEEGDDDDDDVEHETTKTTTERRRKKQPCHRNTSLNRSLISIIKPPHRINYSRSITDTSTLRDQEVYFDSLFDSVVSVDTRRHVDFSTRLEIYFFE